MIYVSTRDPPGFLFATGIDTGIPEAGHCLARKSDVMMSYSSWRAGLLSCAALAALAAAQTTDTVQMDALELSTDALLTIWPQQSEATLQHSIKKGAYVWQCVSWAIVLNADVGSRTGHIWVSASSGGILGSRSLSFDTVAQVRTRYELRP